MDGTEDKILWEETEDVPTTPVDEKDEDQGVYADHLISEEWQNLFGNSNDEDFAGFEWAGTLLIPQRAPLRDTKPTKVNDQQKNYYVFIYSLYLFPALPPSLSLIFSIASCTKPAPKLQKARGVILVSSTQICSLVRWCFDWAIFRSSSALLLSSYLNPLLNSSSRSRLAKCIAIYFCSKPKSLYVLKLSSW